MNLHPSSHPAIISYSSATATRLLTWKSPRISVSEIAGERVFVVHPPGRVRAEVIFCHGLTDHPGRHFHTARRLAREGFRVTLFDLVGHGGRGQPLSVTWPIYKAYADFDAPSDVRAALAANQSLPTKKSFNDEQYEVLRRTRIGNQIEQLERLLDIHSRSSASREPLFLAGFSMGGLIVAETILRRNRNALGDLDLRGALFLSPAFKPQGQPGSQFQNLFVDALFALRKTPFPFPRVAVKSLFELNFPLDASWGIPYMSDLSEEVELYRDDPLVPTILPSAYLSSIETRMASTFDRAALLSVDSFFLIPGRDGITSVSGGLQFAGQIEAAMGRDRCTTVRFESVAAHDLTRSSAGTSSLRSVVSWMEDRVPGRPARKTA